MSTVSGFVGFESEIYVFVVHVPFAFSVPRLSSSGWTRKTAPRASHSVTPKQKKPVQRSFHHLEFIHTCTKKHIWRNHVRVLSGGMRTAPLSEFTFFLCYLWDRKKCKLISDERCQGLDTNSFHFTFYVSCVFREKKTKYRKKKKRFRVLSTEYSVGGAGAVRAPPGAQKTGRRGVSCRGRRKHRKHPKSRKKEI